MSEFEVNRLVAYRSTSGPDPLVLRYIFEPVDAGTRLTEIGEAEPPAMIRLAIRLFLSNAKTNGEQGLRSLKAFLEAETT